MAGFVLKNTLSDNGGVTRGICKMDEDNNLTEVVETKNIVKTAVGAESDGKVIDIDSLRGVDGKHIVETMSPEFVGFVQDAYRSLRYRRK